jgi:hypothetical protein
MTLTGGGFDLKIAVKIRETTIKHESVAQMTANRKNLCYL